MNRKHKIAFLISFLALAAFACTVTGFGGEISATAPENQSASEVVVVTPTTKIEEPEPGITIVPSEQISPLSYITGSRDYNVEQVIELVNDGPGEASRILLWVALIQTIEPYQTVNDYSSDPPEYNTLDDKYDNLYAQYEFQDVPAGETRTVTLNYQITVNKIRVEIDACSGELIEDEIRAEKFIESDSPEIVSLADTLKVEAPDTCTLARSIYDYVADEMTYSVYTAQDQGALIALNQLNGDCTEFSDLFIALNRAAGIPARFVEGVTCCTNSGYQAGENKHDWTEVYLPGYGWVPVDPTWGRFPLQRDRYFAAMSPDHIIVTRGRNLIRLKGYHYYAYNYWWNNDMTSVSSVEKWSIIEAKE